MSKQKPSDNSAQGILDEQQRRSLLIAGYLQNLALPSVYNRELTEQDYELWQKILAPYPLKAIDFAFDNWARNGKVWPKPANILELIGAWKVSNKVEFTSCGHCESGWVRVFEGQTVGGQAVNPALGAVRRCQCFIDWAKAKKDAA